MTDPWKILEKEKKLTPEIRRLIGERYGQRGVKALEIVDEKRVKKYLDFFVVVGSTDEYVVEDEFCTCSDALFRRGGCSHVIAVRIAALTGQYEEFALWYQDIWKQGTREA
ncbi:MAG TPA: SWIM zinc finger family protein [Methanomicrobiales archaeon]|nr:SWIM zinc finger family protein [Methanomicrobiales archaeon]